MKASSTMVLLCAASLSQHVLAFAALGDRLSSVLNATGPCTVTSVSSIIGVCQADLAKFDAASTENDKQAATSLYGGKMSSTDLQTLTIESQLCAGKCSEYLHAHGKTCSQDATGAVLKPILAAVDTICQGVNLGRGTLTDSTACGVPLLLKHCYNASQQETQAVANRKAGKPSADPTSREGERACFTNECTTFLQANKAACAANPDSLKIINYYQQVTELTKQICETPAKLAPLLQNIKNAAAANAAQQHHAICPTIDTSHGAFTGACVGNPDDKCTFKSCHAGYTPASDDTTGVICLKSSSSWFGAGNTQCVANNSPAGATTPTTSAPTYDAVDVSDPLATFCTPMCAEGKVCRPPVKVPDGQAPKYVCVTNAYANIH